MPSVAGDRLSQFGCDIWDIEDLPGILNLEDVVVCKQLLPIAYVDGL
jgi:hypothetical protein